MKCKWCAEDFIAVIVVVALSLFGIYLGVRSVPTANLPLLQIVTGALIMGYSAVITSKIKDRAHAQGAGAATPTTEQPAANAAKKS